MRVYDGMQTGDFYNGFIDDVRIYNIALTLTREEIEELTNEGI